MNNSDEYQLQVCKSLVELKQFKTEQEAEDYTVKGKRMSDVTHSGNTFSRGYSKVGALMSKAIAEAAKSYKMRIPFDGDYQIGNNWKECH